MNFCLSIRQPNIKLNKADEVIVNYKDFNGIYNKLDTMSNKKYIIKVPKDTEIDFKQISSLAQISNILLGLSDLNEQNISNCRQFNIKFYWVYPITTYYELRSLVDLGVSEVLIDAPLFFDLKAVSKFNVPIRVVANVCHSNLFFNKDGICGTYIRPEDVNVYENYVSTIEFVADSLDKEYALFDIYKKGIWNGNLNLLLTNFNYQVDNRIIPDSFGATRCNCRQTCMKDDNCHYCLSIMKYNLTLKKNVKDWIPGVGFKQE